MTRDIIEELNPSWLFLVGIAGGVPAAEYSLGDILLCTRLHDFSACSIDKDGNRTFAISGGPMHQYTEKLLEILPTYNDLLEAQGWNSNKKLNCERPTIDLDPLSLTKNLYGDESWQKKVTDSLTRNFSESRKPKYRLGPTGSSDVLIKNDPILRDWLHSARGLTDVEMELAGVYRAAHNETPILAIRSLSDIIGYERSPEWTQFACESAASFAICLIKIGILPTRINHYVFSNTVQTNLSIANRTIQDNAHILLPLESPFRPYGIVPLNHQSYVVRESDKQLESLLNNESFLCLHGAFRSGKSSLLIRVPHILPTDWTVFQPDFELYQKPFEEELFDELQGLNMGICDWRSLDKVLKRTRMAFLIDEIGKCSDTDASMFIEKIYALFERAPQNHIRVVLTIPISLDIYIGKIGLKHPRYCDCWKNVELTELNETELQELLAKFPQLITLSLKKNLNAIQQCTSMKPNKVQEFCDGLWKYLRREAISISNIDQKVESYLDIFKRA